VASFAPKERRLVGFVRAAASFSSPSCPRRVSPAAIAKRGGLCEIALAVHRGKQDLFKLIRIAYHWAEARQDDIKHGPAAGLLRLARIEALSPLTYYQSAYKAWLLFHAGRTGEADRLFEEVETRLAEPKNPNQAYVRLFCQLFGRFRVSTPEEADAIWEAARAQQCSGMLRRYLPIYDKPSIIHADPRFADLNTSPVANRYRRRKAG
jgi:hypothetical protein